MRKHPRSGVSSAVALASSPPGASLLRVLPAAAKGGGVEGKLINIGGAPCAG